MNRKYIFFFLLVQVLIAFFIGVGFWNYFQHPQGNELYKGMFIFITSSIFLIIFFNLRYKRYKYLFFVSNIISIGAWIYNFVICVYFSIFSKLTLFLWGFIIILCVCCIAPFFSVHSLFLITKYQHKFESNIIKGKHHVHEGFAGIILILIAIGLFLLRLTWISKEKLITEFHIIGTVFIILLTLLLYFGSFLVGRDWKDVINFKFLSLNSDKNTSIDDNETINDKKNMFYTEKPLNTYFLGIILSSMGIFFIFFPVDIFPYHIFHIKAEVIRIFGWFILITGAMLIGFDWIRLLRRFFPDEYEKLNQKLGSKVK